METLLEKLEGKNQFGIATMSDGVGLPVEFCLQSRATFLKVHSPEESRNPVRQMEFLQVRMTDGTCLTFLGNILTEAKSHHGGGGSVLTYLPSFVVIGRQALEPDYQFISVSFSTDDASAIFYDFDAFSLVLAPSEKILELIDYQQEQVGRPIRRGDRPIAAYFNGQYEICSADTALGTFSAGHRPSHGMGGPNGIALKNEIVLKLNLHTPLQLGALVDRIMPILRFLQIVAGRKQKLKRIRCSAKADDPRSELDLLWCLAWSRRDDDEDERGPHPADLPLNGGTEPEAFSRVLTSWLSLDDERLDARARYSGVISKAHYFDIDRLVAAANMFDILPSSCFAGPPELPEDILEVRNSALAKFRALPKSDPCLRAIGDLSRLGGHNLKAKVLQRAAILQKAAPNKFADLDSVLRRAIDSRNHYVHGNEANEAKAAFFREMMSFHTRALEFVFGTSELIEAGWSYGDWARQGTTMSHPWGTFVANYRHAIREHEDGLAALRASGD